MRYMKCLDSSIHSCLHLFLAARTCQFQLIVKGHRATLHEQCQIRAVSKTRPVSITAAMTVLAVYDKSNVCYSSNDSDSSVR